jgi:hypothetical protein
VIIGPGAVKTPIWDKATQTGLSDYAATPYADALAKFKDYLEGGARDGLPVERVGEAVYTALSAPHPRTRYALAPSLLFDWLVPTMLPRRVVDRIFAARLGLTRRA